MTGGQNNASFEEDIIMIKVIAILLLIHTVGNTDCWKI